MAQKNLQARFGVLAWYIGQPVTGRISKSSAETKYLLLAFGSIHLNTMVRVCRDSSLGATIVGTSVFRRSPCLYPAAGKAQSNDLFKTVKEEVAACGDFKKLRRVLDLIFPLTMFKCVSLADRN